MKIVYFRDRRGNFGDDLNPLIWNALLPGHGDDPEMILVGIGSILNAATFASVPRTSRLAILGPGVSYGPPPRLARHWLVAALRGPLSARLLRHESAAITDGAILLAAAPGLVPPVPDAGRGETLFIPHGMSLSPNWCLAARLAGLGVVDPAAPVPETLARIAGARLVLTEAMHGAIVADTLRVPWIPLRISPRFDLFKWRDWTLSMELPLAPVDLPAAGLAEAARNRRQRSAFAETGTGDALPFDAAASCAEMRAYLERRHAGQPYARPAIARPAGVQAAGRLAAGAIDPALAMRAAAALRRAAEGASLLSDERVFSERLARMCDALERVRRMMRGTG